MTNEDEPSAEQVEIDKQRGVRDAHEGTGTLLDSDVRKESRETEKARLKTESQKDKKE